jgi:hypothetical protein
MITYEVFRNGLGNSNEVVCVCNRGVHNFPRSPAFDGCLKFVHIGNDGSASGLQLLEEGPDPDRIRQDNLGGWFEEFRQGLATQGLI